jgi:hypothetical protein
MTDSPRLDDKYVDQFDDAYSAPAPHTDDEIRRLVRLAASRQAHSVIIGHGSDPAATAAARAFADAWRNHGGVILDTVRWAERGASWLGPARILTAVEPDLWVLGGAPAGLAQMIRRLIWSTQWQPNRTIGFASASSSTMRQLAHGDNLEGLIGAASDGGTWGIVSHTYTELPAEDHP